MELKKYVDWGSGYHWSEKGKKGFVSRMLFNSPDMGYNTSQVFLVLLVCVFAFGVRAPVCSPNTTPNGHVSPSAP